MKLVDTSVLLAAASRQDANQKRSIELLDECQKEGINLVITEAIFAEFVTLIARRVSPIEAEKKAQILLESDFEILFTNRQDVLGALFNLKKYSLSSYADGLSMAVCESHGFREIISFDSDFDRNPKIRRVY
jgi:predicted nucleic acid-binding protein